MHQRATLQSFGILHVDHMLIQQVLFFFQCLVLKNPNHLVAQQIYRKKKVDYKWGGILLQQENNQIF